MLPPYSKQKNGHLYGTSLGQCMTSLPEIWVPLCMCIGIKQTLSKHSRRELWCMWHLVRPSVRTNVLFTLDHTTATWTTNSQQTSEWAERVFINKMVKNSQTRTRAQSSRNSKWTTPSNLEQTMARKCNKPQKYVGKKCPEQNRPNSINNRIREFWNEVLLRSSGGANVVPSSKHLLL